MSDARKMRIPDSGDVVHLGGAIADYAVVLTPEAFHRQVGYAWVAPIEPNCMKHPLEVSLEAMEHRGAIQTQRVTHVDVTERMPRVIATVPPRVMEQLRSQIGTVLGIASK